MDFWRTQAEAFRQWYAKQPERSFADAFSQWADSKAFAPWDRLAIAALAQHRVRPYRDYTEPREAA